MYPGNKAPFFRRLQMRRHFRQELKLRMKDMQRLHSGKKLLACLGLLLNSCRTSTPPPMDICLGDGFGGADCQLRAGSEMISRCSQNPKGYYCPPSALLNMWMTTETDEASFAKWAYDTNSSEPIQKGMDKIKGSVK